MKNKKIIIGSVIVGIILCIICVFIFAFKLGKVEFQLASAITVENRSRLFVEGSNVESVQENMLEDAKFEIGSNILTMDFAEQIANIEKANPYVEVIRIVRRFPNKITVYYCEREAVALLPVTNVPNAYLVIDKNLKVLDYITQDLLSSYKLPIINYYASTYQAVAGEFLQDDNLKADLKNVVDSTFSAYGKTNALYEDVMGLMTSITFNVANTTQKRCTISFSANTNANVVFEIRDTDIRFFDKVYHSYQLFKTEYKEDDQIIQDINLIVLIFEDKILIQKLGSNEIVGEYNLK